MIKLLIPQALLENLREFLYEHQNVIFEVYNSDFEEKIKKEYWDIIYVENGKKNVPGNILVGSFDELKLAVRLLESEEKYRNLKRKYDMLYSFPELQGPVINEFLRGIVEKYKGKDGDVLVLKYEDGMYISEYKSFLKLELENVIIRFSKKSGVKIPPLRERKEDIPYIFDIALSSIYLRHKNIERKIPDDFEYELLREYDWPGNTKELINVASVYATTGKMEMPTFKQKVFQGIDLNSFVNKMVKHIEKRYISMALKNSSSRFKAAEMLKINYKTLSYKIKKYGLDKKR